ncbi:MAG: OmpA family protein [Crocinitomicaceae bacterium]|nr:OmpA family protein [Crocinitomicaceae bacterium]
MKIQFFFCFVLLFFSIGKAQNLSDANYWFEKYEYSKSAQIYNACNQIKPLSRDNLKRVAYSYYVIGNYSKSREYLDTLNQWEHLDPFFYYMYGEINYSMMNFDAAKQSYLKINPIPEDFEKEYHVSAKIAACDQLVLKKIDESKKIIELPNNTTKADINGPNFLISSPSFSSKKIIYKEKAKDSSGAFVNTSQLDSAELFLLRPYIVDHGFIEIIDSVAGLDLTNCSVNSIANSPLNNIVYIALSLPLQKKPIDKVSRIYEGVFSADFSTITINKPWDYSGYQDSSSCAHVSTSENGRFLIFSKISDSTNGSDIFMSVYKSDLNKWAKPKPIIEINTPFDDMYPMYSGDSVVIFSSNSPYGYGGLDLYQFQFSNGIFSEKKHLDYPINSFKDDFNCNWLSDGSHLYFSSNRMGTGDDDIYFIDYTTKDSLVSLLDELDSSYQLRNNTKENIQKELAIQSKWDNKNLYFDFDSDKLKEELEVSSLLEYLINNPNKSVLLKGHTDSRGSNTYNKDLAMRRAKRTRDYLVSKGVPKEKIVLRSYGEIDPPVKCKKSCSQKDHSLNRVVIIDLVSEVEIAI